MADALKTATVWALAILLIAPLCLASSDYDDAIQRGREAMRLRNYPAAAVAYQQATQVDPANPDGWFRLGLAQSAAGEGDEAIVAYGRTAELDPAHAKARNNLGNVLFRRGNYDEALTWYERALAIDPDYLLALYHQGWVLRHRNDNEKAEAAFVHCLQLQPKSNREAATKLDCLFFVGTMRFRAEDYGAASKTMEQVLSMNPGHVESHYYLGMSYRRMGRIDDARRELETHRQMLKSTRREMPVERADP